VNSAFRWYLGGVGSWFAGYGMASILFPWLVAVVLHESPARLGWAQLALMGPSTAFLLFGGAVADRADGRRLLIRYHLIALLPPIALGAAIAAGAASYPVVLAYGATLGTLAAFIMPARDALLTRISSIGVPRAIALATATQMICQLAGIALAGGAGRIGALPLLAVQALVLGAGAATAARLAPAPPMRVTGGGNRLAEMREGLRAVAHSERILPVVIAIAAVGTFFVGAFIVIIPLMVRDVHGGGASELAIINFCFWGGMLVAALVQARLRQFHRPGRAIIVVLTFGSGILAAMALPLPFRMLAALCAVWGLGAGVTMTQARTIVQMAARDSHRARVLAVFQLGLIGGAPLGAVVFGYVAAAVGPRHVPVYPALAMLVVLAWLGARSGLWRQEAHLAHNESVG
jgi:MFS family permease